MRKLAVLFVVVACVFLSTGFNVFSEETPGKKSIADIVGKQARVIGCNADFVYNPDKTFSGKFSTVNLTVVFLETNDVADDWDANEIEIEGEDEEPDLSGDRYMLKIHGLDMEEYEKPLCASQFTEMYKNFQKVPVILVKRFPRKARLPKIKRDKFNDHVFHAHPVRIGMVWTREELPDELK
jgi:hypothetical protein